MRGVDDPATQDGADFPPRFSLTGIAALTDSGVNKQDSFLHFLKLRIFG
jgi:hypothetical protein